MCPLILKHRQNSFKNYIKNRETWKIPLQGTNNSKSPASDMAHWENHDSHLYGTPTKSRYLNQITDGIIRRLEIEN